MLDLRSVGLLNCTAFWDHWERRPGRPWTLFFPRELKVGPLCLCWFPLEKTEKARGLEGVVKRPWSVPSPGLKVLSLGASWENMTDFQDSRDIPGLRPRGPRRCQLKSRSILSFSRRDDVDWLGKMLLGVEVLPSPCACHPGLPPPTLKTPNGLSSS